MEYLKSAFNYTGSKYVLLDKIFPYFPKPEEVNTFYDLFTGGGSVFINTTYDNIVANDVLKPLIGFYKELKDNDWETVKRNVYEFVISKTSQEEYLELRQKYNDTKNPYAFFSLVQSCTNNMMRFNKSGGFNQTWGKRSYNPNTEIKLQGYHTKIQNLNVDFRCADYKSLFDEIVTDKRNFVYGDSPYSITEAGYNTTWDKYEDAKFIEFVTELDNHGIKFAFSNVSEHKGIENPYLNDYKKWDVINIDHDYHKVSRGLTSTQEILVKNY